MKKRKILIVLGCLLFASLLLIPEVRALEEDYELINICESKSVMKILYMVKVLFTIVQFAVPFILIITMSLDVYNLVADPSNTKKVFPVIKKRLIAALVIFFVPTILNLVLSALGDETSVSECWNNADPAIYESFEN